jgi:Aspartyl protease
MMKFLAAACAVLCFSQFFNAQEKPSPPKSVTVPLVIDHNRVLIDVEVPVQNGGTKRVRAWVDNGDPELEMSESLAKLTGPVGVCGGQTCSASAPKAIQIGDMEISFASLKEAKFPVGPNKPLAPGLDADMTIPSTVLRHYDVLIDYPGRKFSIGTPGSLHFLGTAAKVQINGENGLIQIPSKIENKKYNFALDLGSSISFLSEDLFSSLAASHSDWPHMTGAVGSASMWGADEETKWQIMRLDRVQFGPLFLTDVPVVSLPKATRDFFEKRAAMPTVGLIGANTLQNYRVGLDYAHSTVYFDIGRLFNFPDFDVVGLFLRPEDNRRYAILGVAELDGKPSVLTGPDGIQAGDFLVAINDIPVQGSTMGQVWSLLGGTPGQERKLTIERAGKQFVVAATVQHFLAASTGEDEKKKKKK